MGDDGVDEVEFVGGEGGVVDGAEVGFQLGHRRGPDDYRCYPLVGQDPCQGHLRQRLAAACGDFIEATGAGYLVVGDL